MSAKKPPAGAPTHAVTLDILNQSQDTAKRRKLNLELHLGTVGADSTNTNGLGSGYIQSVSVDVTLDGDTAAITAQTVTSYVVSGARVVVLYVPHAGYFVVGYAGEAAMAEARRGVFSSTTDASAVSTDHGLQVGTTDGANMIMDGNELMARNAGVEAPIFINKDGGVVNIGNAAANINLMGAVSAGNEVFGGVSIVAGGSVVTSAVVSYAALSGTGTVCGWATANSGVPGAVVVECSVSSPSSTSIQVNIYRTGANVATTVFYQVKQQQ